MDGATEDDDDEETRDLLDLDSILTDTPVSEFRL